MTRHESGERAGFHELPLVLFTGFSVAGAGVGAAHFLLACLGWVPWVPPSEMTTLILVLVALGLLFSAGHLGRPFRSPLALLRSGRSSLSNEVLAVGLVLVASLLSATLPVGHILMALSGVATLVSSVLLLLALGQVYHLPGQLTWSGPARIHPLVLGLAFGLTLLMGTLPMGTRARSEILVLVLLSIDGLLVWERARRIGNALEWGIPAQRRFISHRGLAFTLRILLGILLPAGALIRGWPELAGLSLFMNLLLDRLLFYGFAVRRNTESEVMRVEAALRAGPESDSPVGTPDPIPTSIQANEY